MCVCEREREREREKEFEGLYLCDSDILQPFNLHHFIGEDREVELSQIAFAMCATTITHVHTRAQYTHSPHRRSAFSTS